ncbi:MAG: glycosyltransferase family 1 protein [Verrucomicrobiales bacterium]|nr:glycosyltransferase family 1 protein [Verrucomicrobiales bacterium]
MPATKRRIGVDLTPMHRGGVNGGVKPLILQSLSILAEQLKSEAVFVFFTNSATHREVRKLASAGDELVCVVTSDREELPCPVIAPVRESIGDGEDLMLPIRLGIEVLYCPFGAVTFASPGIPTVACIVDLIHLDYPMSLTGAEIAYREAYLKETMEVSDSLNCISRHVAGRVRESFPDFEGTIFHTYNAIQNRFSHVPESEEELSIENYFFFPANFWPHKNHEVLLIAYQLYSARLEEDAWDLVLTGESGERQTEMQELAAAMMISDRVHFPGFVAESFLKKIWSQCSCLVFPSLHEGFGIPLLEAMHFGKPVISSNSCCLPEVGGDACLYVDPTKPIELAGAMESIHRDMSLRERLVKNGVQRLGEFTISCEIEKLNEALMTAKPRAQWQKGIYGDGWIGEDALLSIPERSGRWRLAINVSGRNIPTFLSVFCSGNSFGTHEIPVWDQREIVIWMRDPAGVLNIHVADPCRLSEKDKRLLGARLLSVTLKSESGETVDLFKL